MHQILGEAMLNLVAPTLPVVASVRSASAVPGPQALLMMAAGVVALLSRRRRAA